MSRPIDVFDGLDLLEEERIVEVIQTAMSSASSPPDDEPKAPPTIQEFPELIGIDPEVYRQLNDALAAGARHFMFYGPPGTGKTTLAQRVAGVIHDEWKLITGSSDWTSQDIIGGYHPLAGGNIIFQPGVLLEHFDKPLIFDELNRCDIDKVIGPLFTVLSGQSTTLPYLTDPANPASPRIEILPDGRPNPPQSYAPSPQWRLIATINSVDKSSLYQMSYALTRRFAWIYLDAPADPKGFIREYLSRERDAPVDAEAPNPLGDIWEAVNQVRAVGPAPFLDIMKLIRARRPDFDLLNPVPNPAQADPYLDGIYVHLLPMLDGILQEQASKLGDAIAASLNLGDDPRAERLKARITGLAL